MTHRIKKRVVLWVIGCYTTRFLRALTRHRGECHECVVRVVRILRARCTVRQAGHPGDHLFWGLDNGIARATEMLLSENFHICYLACNSSFSININLPFNIKTQPSVEHLILQPVVFTLVTLSKCHLKFAAQPSRFPKEEAKIYFAGSHLTNSAHLLKWIQCSTSAFPKQLSNESPMYIQRTHFSNQF